MKKTSKILAAVLSAALAFGVCGCAKGGEGGGGGTSSPALTAADLDLWTIPATEKALQDLEYEHTGDKLEIEMYANEEEATQLIITPAKDVAAYTAVASDLSDGNGHTIPAANISLYHEMYMHVSRLTKAGSGFPTGWYPDPLLPLKTAEEYGENKIAANQNQAIYYSVKTAPDQAAGVYTGEISVTAGGATVKMPVSVTVWNWAVPDENHLRSVFSLSHTWDMGGLWHGTLDTTFENYERYYDDLADFRLSARYMPHTLSYAYSSVEKAVEYAIKAYDNPKINTYVIPWQQDHSAVTIDTEYWDEVITALMTASIETGKDLFSEGVTYFSHFDEANGDSAKEGYAKSVLGFIKQYNAEFKSNHDFTSVKGYDPVKYEQYVDSMLGVEQLFVGYYADTPFFETFTQANYNYTWCPTFSHYHDEQERAIYQNVDDVYSDELWWYGCVSPKNPYPTYHIDDWGYSPRVVSWMQYKYGVTGNLYWSVCEWAKDASAKLQDIYSEPMQFPGVNGDGFLFYPGQVFGLDGPVNSIRLHQIRDGMEDYEALYALGQKAEALLGNAGIEGDVQNALGMIYDSLFSGTMINTDSEKLASARRMVAQLLEAADVTDAIVYDSSASGNNRVFKLYAPAGTTIEAQGATSEDVTKSGSVVGKIYTVTVDGSEEGATFDFKATKGDKTVEVSMPLGARRIGVTAADLVKGISGLGENDSAEAVSDNGVKVTFGADSRGVIRYSSDLFGSLDLGKTILYCDITNDSASTARITITVKGSKSATLESVGAWIDIAPGETRRDLSFNLSGLDWNKLGEIEYLRIAVTGDAVSAITLDNLLFTE